MMVGRQNQQDRILFLLRSLQRRHGNGRGRIFPHRFQNDGPRLNTLFAQLFGDHKPVVLVADHNRGGQILQPLETPQGLLDHGRRPG